MKKLLLIAVLAWIVGFYRDYTVGKWYWVAHQSGAGWNFAYSGRPGAKIEPTFLTKEECVQDFQNFLSSQDDRKFREKNYGE
jgi:hypothetical protein